MNKHIRSQRAFSLLHILIVLALMTIGMMTSLDMLSQHQKQILTTKVAINRDSVASLIRFAASKNSALQASYVNIDNTLFSRCVRGKDPDGTPYANGCPTGVNPLKLLDQAGALVAGQPFSPVYYDANGAMCTGDTSNCPLQAQTTFTAECPGGTFPCDQAVSVTITYTVSQNSTGNYKGYASLKPFSATITKTTTDITSAATLSLCSPNKCVIGINADCTVICEP